MRGLTPSRSLAALTCGRFSRSAVSGAVRHPADSKAGDGLYMAWFGTYVFFSATTYPTRPPPRPPSRSSTCPIRSSGRSPGSSSTAGPAPDPAGVGARPRGPVAVTVLLVLSCRAARPVRERAGRARRRPGLPGLAVRGPAARDPDDKPAPANSVARRWAASLLRAPASLGLVACGSAGATAARRRPRAGRPGDLLAGPRRRDAARPAGTASGGPRAGTAVTGPVAGAEGLAAGG